MCVVLDECTPYQRVLAIGIACVCDIVAAEPLSVCLHRVFTKEASLCSALR